MAFKPRYKYTQYPGINFKKHWLTGTIWPCQGKHDMYHVEMLDKGFQCDCPGFTYHGKCRHITRVGAALSGHKSFHTVYINS